MATLEEIVVQLTAETSQLKAELKNATGAVQQSSEKMEKALKEFSDSSKKSLTFTQTALATMSGFLGSQAVLGAFNLLKDAAGAAWGALLEGVEAAEKEEEAMARLVNSMTLTGKATATTRKDMTDFAGAMEELTGVGDDVVLSNLAMLSSMTKLDKEGLQAAQKAALDLSAAYGIDLDSATKAVGKAIEGNTDGLKKFGIEVQGSADKTQRFSNIMTALASTNGAAEAKMKTFAGAVTGLENSFGNFVEEIAKAVTGNAVLIAALGEASKIFSELTNAAEGNGTALRTGIANAFLFIADATVVALQGVDAFLRALNAGVQAVLVPVFALIDGVRFLGNVITGDMDAAKESFAGTAGAAQDVWDTLSNQGVLGDVADKVQRIRDAGANAFGGLSESAAEAAPALGGVTAKVVELTEAQKVHQEVIKSFAEGLAQQTNALNSELEFRRQLLEINAEADVESQLALNEQKLTMLQEQFAAENQALADARAQGLITEQQYNDAQTALTQQHILQSQKQLADRQKAEEAVNKARLQGYSTFFQGLAVLSQSGNQELAAIGKAAAISQATVDAYLAIQNALATVPYPANIAAAAGIGIQAFANVSKIAGVGFNKGVDSVPGMGNSDSVSAMLTPGERVVTAEQNKDLTAFLARQGDGGGQSVTVNLNVTVAPGTGMTSEQAGNLIESLNSYIANGGLKLLSSAVTA